MTRTGKSNTVKKIIQATVLMSSKATYKLGHKLKDSAEENLEAFTKDEILKYRVGQLIFDVNGEYANANMQDEGTAIFELYKEQTTRYSTIKKDGFKVMKVNFYGDVISGFELVWSHLTQSTGNYIENFCAVDFVKPADYDKNHSVKTRHDRKEAAYLCCLYKAGFTVPKDFKVKFSGNVDLNKLVKEDGSLDPSKGISLEEASDWFTTIWDNYQSNSYFSNYKKDMGHEWADEDLKALLVFLSRKRSSGGNVNIDGYIKLRGITDLHTETVASSTMTFLCRIILVYILVL